MNNDVTNKQNMKKIMLLLALSVVSSLAVSAQDDDLYFTPKKQANRTVADDNTPAYYSGCDKTVDEYNRRGKYRSRYQNIEADGQADDVISFTPGTCVYPDSTYTDSTFTDVVARKYRGSLDDEDGYEYTRRLSRWDGFYGPWYAGWHSPFWYSRYGWYDPWYWDYAGWYDPWYYGYHGWYNPWYLGCHWGWHGWYDHWYGPHYGWGGVAIVPSGTGRTIAGTRNHGTVTGRPGSTSARGSFSSRNNHGTATTQNPSGRFGSRSTTYNRPSYSNSNNSYGNSTPSFSGSRSYGSGSSSSGGGFSGSRSGGFSGSRSGGGGGGHFGGRR